MVFGWGIDAPGACYFTSVLFGFKLSETCYWARWFDAFKNIWHLIYTAGTWIANWFD